MKTYSKLLVAALLAAGLAVPSVAAAQGADAESEEMAAPEEDTSAQADVELSSDHPAASKSIVLAPHIGAIFPQLTSELGTWPIFGLSGGYILPFYAAGFTRPLEVGLDLM